MQLIINTEDMRWGDLRAFVAAGAANADDEEVIFEHDMDSGAVTGLYTYVIDEQVTPPPAWWVERWRKADDDEKGVQNLHTPGGDLLDAVAETGNLVEGLRQQLKDDK